MDNDFRYWKALGNRYWPSFYLVDQKGRIIHRSAGEMKVGDSYAKKFEDKIKSLLN